MRRTTAEAIPSDALQQVLDWLAQPVSDDPLLDMVPLRKHVKAIEALGRPVLHRVKITELLQVRADRIDAALLPLLLDAKLPLPDALAVIAHGLISLRAALGEAWLAIAKQGDSDELRRVHRSLLQICLRGMDNMSQQLKASLMIATPTPTGLWKNIQTLYHFAKNSIDPIATYPVEMSMIDGRLKSMLALATAQPEGMTPREIDFLAGYLIKQSVAVQLDPFASSAEDDGLWVHADIDQPPTAMARSAPPPGICIHFRCSTLAELAGRHLAELADGVPARLLDLPIQGAGSDYQNALERARQCWKLPRRRSFHRSTTEALVDVCVHLGTLWATLSGKSGQSQATGDESPAISQWLLQNEGPAGFSMTHTAGEVSGIVAGCAIGLRTGRGAPWQICLVRWARSDHARHLMLGVEILAPSAVAIRLRSQHQHHTQSGAAALLLPALPTLNRTESVLSARGNFNARPFTLLQEHEGHLHITECTPTRSIVETSSVEVFEFCRSAN